jgi:hypothetical protein
MILDTNKSLNEDSFEYYYSKSNPGNKSTYTAVKNYMQQLFYHIINYTDYDKIDNVLMDVSEIVTRDNNDKEISKKIGVNFITLWKERFYTIKEEGGKKVPYKGMFRFEIHKNISQISYLQTKNKPKIRVLTLRKARKDLVHKIYKNIDKLNEIKNLMDSQIVFTTTKDIITKAKALTLNKHLNSFNLSLFDKVKSFDKSIFNDDLLVEIISTFKYSCVEDIFKIKTDREEFIYLYKLLYAIKNYETLAHMFIENMRVNIEVKKSYKNRLKSWIAYGIYDFAYLESKDNSVNLYKDEYIPLHCDLYYFDSKYILMEVAEPIEGTYQDSGFSLIMNIELKKTELKNKEISKEKMSGYNNLNGAIDEIYKALDCFRKNIKFANIYKSLGPKDLTVIIEEAELKTLYEIIKKINSLVEINRTFTIFCSLNGTSKKNIGDDFILNSYIRVPKGSKLFDDKDSKAKEIFESIAKNKNEVFYTTGVMDIAIKWNHTKTLQELFDEYEKLIPYMTDYQTKIEKRFVVGIDKDKEV